MLLLFKMTWRLLLLAIFAAPVVTGPAVAADADRLSRIVSIGGDVTEILFELGAGRGIVAVDTTSQYPASDVKALKNVGYMRALSTEGVLSMSPTLIIASGGAGPPEVVAALKAAAFPFVEVNAANSPEGVVEKVRTVAHAVGRETESRALIERIEAQFANLARARGTISSPRKALFVLSYQGGRAVVAGSKTSVDAMFHLAGIVNAASEFEGFKPISPEAIITAAPDAIVIMRREGGTTAHEIASAQGFASSPAAKSGRIIEVDGSYALQFGPRAALAGTDLMRQVYPELDASAGQ